MLIKEDSGNSIWSSAFSCSLSFNFISLFHCLIFPLPFPLLFVKPDQGVKQALRQMLRLKHNRTVRRKVSAAGVAGSFAAVHRERGRGWQGKDDLTRQEAKCSPRQPWLPRSTLSRAEMCRTAPYHNSLHRKMALAGERYSLWGFLWVRSPNAVTEKGEI